MMEPFIGQIILFAGNYAPLGWAFCHGQLLPIHQNQVLFALLGTTYGGNGQTTFALPDLRGCVPIEFGQGAGLSDRQLGEKGGSETVTLTEAELPVHKHDLKAVTTSAPSTDPSHNLLAKSRVLPTFAPVGKTQVVMNEASVTGGGSNQPHDNMPPFVAMNYIIALQGIFPTRN